MANPDKLQAAQAREKEILWQLRQLLKDRFDQTLSFARLVNDLDYRLEIIKKARGYGHPEANQLIDALQRLSGMTVTGSIAPGSVQTVAAKTPASATRRGAINGAIAAFMLLSVLGAGFGFLASSGLLQSWLAASTTPGAMDVTPGETITIKGSILEHTLWKASNTYFLEGLVFVESGAALTIEAGTKVYGKPGSALIITRDSKIYARGSATHPIVFTSAQKVGERKRGDWGGLVMLGQAQLNRKKNLNDPNEVGTAHVEGITEDDPRGRFGGVDNNHNCGLLEYVRIEFAGFKIAANNELNGLTLGGCGKQTVINYVQSHMGADDGVEIFGGAVDLQHLVITGADDDGLDWDMGWQGRVQFLVVQQHADGGDSAIEADNWKAHPDAQPRSQGVIYNATLLGSHDISKDQRGPVFRVGTGIVLRNSIVAGFSQEGIDIRDKETAALFKAGISSCDGLIIYDIKGRVGSEPASYFPKEEADKDDDGGFNEAEYFSNPKHARFIDPGLTSAAYEPANPNFTPTGTTTLASYIPTPTESGEGMEFWNASADFIGAVRPGSQKTWLDNWTAFPLN